LNSLEIKGITGGGGEVVTDADVSPSFEEEKEELW